MKGRPLRVLCLGGGFVAVDLAKKLRRAIRRGEVDLTVVSRDNFHAFHGFVAEMIVGKLQPGQIASPARRIFPPAHFRNAEVEAIDLDGQTVTISRILDGRQYELPYDHLVLGLGVLDDVNLYPGLAEHAMTLREYWDDFKARNHLISMLEMADVETDPEERRRLLTFVIAGGNFGGIEVITEIRDLLDDLLETEFSEVPSEDARVVLVHAADRILPELLTRQPKLVRYAERVLAKQDIEFKLGTRLQAATPEEAILNNGERIPTRTIISCTGSVPVPVLAALGLESDGRGRIVTDSYLRVSGHDNVWAAGDCAAVPHPKGGTCPPLAIYAKTHGALIARNLRRITRGKDLKRYRFTGLGDACSLGQRKAVAHIKGFRLYGLPAWMIWRTFLLRYVPTWDRRVRMALDWALWPFLGRDIVNMEMREPYGLKRQLYEKGQDIVREGDVGRELFLIWKGEVEVIARNDDGEKEVVATLEEGQHFGEIAIFKSLRRTATVRAKTRVELLAVGKREALALSDAVEPFGTAIRRLPEGAETGP
jgi:NADH:ubiquinone reductase (H+-translocating)